MSASSSSSSSLLPLPHYRQQCGPYLFCADFDSANLKEIEYVGAHSLSDTFTPPHVHSSIDVFHAFLHADPNSNYRVWFYFSMKISLANKNNDETGTTTSIKGKTIHIIIKNLNNKKALFASGFFPIYRNSGTASSQWKRVHGVEYKTLKMEQRVCSYLKENNNNEEQKEDGNNNNQEDGSSQEEEDGEKEEEDDEEEEKKTVSQSKRPSSSSTSSSTSTSKSSSKSSSSSFSSSKYPDTMELTMKYICDGSEMNNEIFFAFCLPFSYTQLQQQLCAFDKKFSKSEHKQTAKYNTETSSSSTAAASSSSSSSSSASSSIYYHRELLIHSLEHRRIDLVSISSSTGRSNDFESNLPHLYPAPTEQSHKQADIAKYFSHQPENNTIPALQQLSQKQYSLYAPETRAHIFPEKPIIFVSARVHSGECWSAGTKLIMSDGSMKTVENIVRDSKLGMQQELLGDNGSKRMVQRGSEIDGEIGELYEVTYSTKTQNDTNAVRPSWSCTGKHVLVLEFNLKSTVEYIDANNWRICSPVIEGNQYKFHYSSCFSQQQAELLAQQLDATLLHHHHSLTTIVEVTVLDYLTSSNDFKKHARMYQHQQIVFNSLSVGSSLKERIVSFSRKNSDTISSIEEISNTVAYFLGMYLITNNIELIQQQQQQHPLLHSFLSESQPLLQSLLHSYHLFLDTKNNAFIPQELKCDSITTRYYLLSGLMFASKHHAFNNDADCHQLHVTSATLLQDIVFVARSVGCICTLLSSSTPSISSCSSSILQLTGPGLKTLHQIINYFQYNQFSLSSDAVLIGCYYCCGCLLWLFV